VESLREKQKLRDEGKNERQKKEESLNCPTANVFISFVLTA
jgi:hypothetical protein